jgi:hypothetical protein
MVTPDAAEKMSDEEQEEQEKIIIMTAVARTHEFLKEIVYKDSASNASMGWYVQVKNYIYICINIYVLYVYIYMY